MASSKPTNTRTPAPGSSSGSKSHPYAQAAQRQLDQNSQRLGKQAVRRFHAGPTASR